MNKNSNIQVQRDLFVASIGHDLKNPTIAQIRGLELLLKGNFGKLTTSQQEIIQMLLESCKYMNGMLSSLLSTYRNYGGKIKLSFEEFSLYELVTECVSEMIYVAKEKNINIIQEFNNNLNNITGDIVQIKRVIMNLLSNAIKYAFNSTDLTLILNSTNNDIYFEFQNSSPYIPIEKQKTLFKKYVTLNTDVHHIGNGLGLYTSKQIIEAHNGEIYVKSFKDEHNIFGFKLPFQNQSFNNNEIIL